MHPDTVVSAAARYIDRSIDERCAYPAAWNLLRDWRPFTFAHVAPVGILLEAKHAEHAAHLQWTTVAGTQRTAHDIALKPVLATQVTRHR